ncbi:hypothetical protein QYE76_041940 [Lolium multiflorum]|uniref:Uncharacterized protein n=1 Tax=Lolium multiflorum TaxID=4521 RepID=A0AAD8WU77_LOLMU|nr:hypothetical protein QYE76_041940 [Lolium multiflorum]
MKKEPTSPPPTRGRSSGALVIRDQPSPQRGRKRKTAKNEAAAAAANQLAEEEAKRAEDAAVEAIARSLKDLVPADNSLPIDAAQWSQREGAPEAEQRRMLDLAAARQLAARAARRPRGTPRPGR